MVTVYCDANNDSEFAMRHVTMYVHAREQATCPTLCRYMHKQSCSSAKKSAKARGLMRVRNALQLSWLPFSLPYAQWSDTLRLP